jgi:transcriptional regulator with GAF, ATPase, and Fis domain
MGFDEKTTLHAAKHSAGLRAGQFRITVTAGPDAGARLEIDLSQPSRALVGQSQACTLALADPLVSRRHLALSVHGTELAVSDLGSTNGTYLEGIRITEAFARGGESIRLGSSVLRVDSLGDREAPALEGPDRFGPLVGASRAMRRIFPLLERLAGAHVPVVIEGETGTGKEVLAEALHEAGPRRDGPFVVFDCTAVAPTLVETALFGHDKGAFTGADVARRGVFEEAHGGTLLIDEIGDLDPSLQPKLLRALQRSEIRRVGGDRWVQVDVRVLAATRRDLEREVQRGRFREDLFYRLAVARVELPPLRERGGDVGLLARHFWDRHGGAQSPIPYDLFASWESAPWPGNVRELENAVLRRLALGDLAPESSAGRPLPVSSPQRLELDVHTGQPLALARERTLREFERHYLEALLARHDGRTPPAALEAGVTPRYLNMMRVRYGM